MSIPLRLDLIAPVDLKPDPSDEGILYVADQAGFVWIIDDGHLQTEPLLDVTDRLVQPLGPVRHPG